MLYQVGGVHRGRVVPTVEKLRRPIEMDATVQKRGNRKGEPVTECKHRYDVAGKDAVNAHS
ncbi:hypothetical protein F2Q70_00036498 [Brassica cretica]|uniref:Uncharacterized protein n=1 Tax=Brassica cretica TaxID=69181 RepID=A0A8S9JVE2_BRACR|nr:hypothetical protein F2Q70_00036498 [Brassica cretica]